MLSYLVHKLSPTLTPEQCRKFGFLTFCYFLLIGAQWPAKTLKDSLIVSELGADNQPLARAVSVLLCIAMSFFYGQMVSRFRRENVLYLILGGLVSLGAVLSVLIKLYFMGIFPIGQALVIYGFYVYIDMVTVLSIPTFWAFVSDVTTPDEAKKGFTILALAGQFGGLITTLIGERFSGNTQNYYMISSFSVGLLVVYGFSLYRMMHTVPKEDMRGYVADQKKVQEKHSMTFLKGLLLIAASPYVFGLFFLTAAQEILTSVMQFKMFKVVEATFMRDAAATSAFQFKYSIAIQIVSTVVSFGSAVLRLQDRLGNDICILLYPALVMLCFVGVYFFPVLLVVSGAMAVMKGLHYALNKPSREALYIPTTKEVKYKSKAWIDVFGTRLFKLTGSSINKYFFANIDAIIALFFLSWIPIAGYVGYTYKKSVEENKTVV